MPCPHVRRVAIPLTTQSRCIAARANKGSEDKSWSEIAAEAADVVKSVVNKVKDTASSALHRIKQKPSDSTPARQQQQQSVYGRTEDRPLPMTFPGGGGLLGGLVGGLVNTAIKGIAEQLEKSAQDSRSVSENAAERISSSYQVKQRLGEVTVGLPMSQSVASQSVNGRTSKTISLLLPLYNAAGAPVAQAQVRMPAGDSISLDDDNDDDDSGSSGGSKTRSKVTSSPAGEVIDAEFRDLK
eukprot:gene4602-4856_t